MNRWVVQETPTIDRFRPTLRPARRPRGYQSWRSLLFLHWPVGVEALRPLVPPTLEIDTFAGMAYVGIVAFAMQGVRASWVPKPLGLNFLETNVRTYVHVDGRDPGVYFFSLDADARLAVWGARRFWRLPYHWARMTLTRRSEVVEYDLTRQTKESVRFHVEYSVKAAIGTASPGTLDHFLIERYLMHITLPGDQVIGAVHHDPYPLHRADILSLDESLSAAAGLPEPHGEPLVHYSPGVNVEIFSLEAP